MNTKKEVLDVKSRLKVNFVEPLFHEFHLKDILQIMIGAAILAIPVGFTEETWRLGEVLPLSHIIGFIILSLSFTGAFVYYHYHRHHCLKAHHMEFIKRVVSTYLLSFLVVAVLMTLIQKAPWSTNWLLAFKRVVLVTFPASMSGTIADVIK